MPNTTIGVPNALACNARVDKILLFMCSCSTDATTHISPELEFYQSSASVFIDPCRLWSNFMPAQLYVIAAMLELYSYLPASSTAISFMVRKYDPAFLSPPRHPGIRF